AIAVQSDGKIIIGGSFTSSDSSVPYYLARLNADGSPDTTFDHTLYVDGVVNTVVVQPDGKILFGGGFNVVGAYLRKFLARLETDGTLDTTFDACIAAGAGAGVTGLALQPDKKILASGILTFSTGAFRQGIARLGECGDLDQSYAPQPG